MPNFRVNSNLKFLALITGIFILLLLSLVNIKNYTSEKKVDDVVLGAKTEEISDVDFWNSYLNQNPNYIPGWIEIGRFDKVKQIDPNYF